MQKMRNSRLGIASIRNYFFVVCVLFSLTAQAEQHSFPNLLFLKEGEKSPKADLSVLAWLAGHWKGEAFGGITEEIWAPALGGSMMGAFRLVNDDKVSFYEIETISEENESLIFRLKHFNRDLTAWEEKEKTVDFKLVKVVQDKVFFDGLTIEKINDQKMNLYVAIDNKGTTTEKVFPYTRVE